MGSTYIKAPKGYISKKLVEKNLGLQQKEFDKLVTLCGIHPYIPKENRKVDSEDGFYYKVSDASKLAHSDAYRIMQRNKMAERRKRKYIGTGLEYKINNIRHEEYGYVDIIKDRYKSLGEAIDELGRTLSSLYLCAMLGLCEKAAVATKEFEEFIAEKRLLECSFMAKNGVYHQISFGEIKVIWFVPYPGMGLRGSVEEKHDPLEKEKWNTPDGFTSYEDEDISSSEADASINDPSKIDISLLLYSIPLFVTHCRLILHKMRKLCGDDVYTKKEMFSGLNFYVKSDTIGRHLELIILCCNGQMVCKPEDANIYVSEAADELLEDTQYVQPQYVFDCLNEGKRLNIDKYLVGKALPKHKSPFVSTSRIISEEYLSTLSMTQRNRIEDVVHRFEDVEYER